MTKMNDVDKINEKNILKINLFSKNENILNLFLDTIKAKKFRKLNIGVEFAFLLTKENRFQFWLIERDFSNENSKFRYLTGSKGIIFFYRIDEKINEECLIFIKRRIQENIPMLFVRYDSDTFDPSEIPKKIADMNYQNFEMIGKYFEEFNLLYVSADSDSMMFVLNKIAELNEIKKEKRELK